MRADVFLTVHGFAESRSRAKQLIGDGCVFRKGKAISKPSEELQEDAVGEITVSEQCPYVGRGGRKLEAALEAFGIDVSGRFALDVGASTGGFTDCLLQRGAEHVCAVDAGEGQLAAKLRNDSRVCSLEHRNARDLTPEMIGGRVSLIVMDVSFISATYIIPRFPELLTANGDAVCLVKPQFEVGRERIGKGGIVKDPRLHRFAVDRVLSSGREAGLHPVGLIPSPIEGGDGNREFLVRFRLSDDMPEVGSELVTKVTEKENRP